MCQVRQFSRRGYILTVLFTGSNERQGWVSFECISIMHVLPKRYRLFKVINVYQMIKCHRKIQRNHCNH